MPLKKSVNEQYRLAATNPAQGKRPSPFKIDAMVILPEHLHCIWTLPPGDADYKTRWALIKAGFSLHRTQNPGNI
ncbi:hypothetical protein AU255_08520 [Methyloprofundus sedimenti]|uniref:Transposase IS200-like domain-containing protein n=1 Tax=Methyloprofundus sedimenti TaxID=1420851 RepID=A0A1V8M8G9_9GAMM|nr:transposase [Methyloprofundus sedimenti]OQK17890.1 hypothetical protein AU255_08520 [Methyloprofundus sedimenti]